MKLKLADMTLSATYDKLFVVKRFHGPETHHKGLLFGFQLITPVGY